MVLIIACSFCKLVDGGAWQSVLKCGDVLGDNKDSLPLLETRMCMCHLFCGKQLLHQSDNTLKLPFFLRLLIGDNYILIAICCRYVMCNFRRYVLDLQ